MNSHIMGLSIYCCHARLKASRDSQWHHLLLRWVRRDCTPWRVRHFILKKRLLIADLRPRLIRWMPVVQRHVFRISGLQRIYRSNLWSRTPV